MNRFPTAVWLAVAVAGVGCERSAVNATDAISVKGTLQDSAGVARAGSTVKLRRGPPRVDGAECPLLLGDAWKTATAGADGSYQFDFTGKDSQTGDLLGTSEGGNLARCFRIAVEGPTDASAAADFTVQVTAVSAPTLHDYAAALAVSGLTGSANFTWVAPASGAAPTGYSLGVTDDADDSVWSASSSAGVTSASLPDYAFEGKASRAQVSATAEERVSGTIWPVSVVAESIAVAARGTVPASRGAGCDLASPCPLTDGVFHAVNVDREAVVVTFAAPIALSRVLLRGVSATGDKLLVETSTDGTTFTTLAEVAYHSGLHDLAAPAAVLAKSVRVKSTSTKASNPTPKISQLAELSVVP